MDEQKPSDPLDAALETARDLALIPTAVLGIKVAAEAAGMAAAKPVAIPVAIFVGDYLFRTLGVLRAERAAEGKTRYDDPITFNEVVERAQKVLAENAGEAYGRIADTIANSDKNNDGKVDAEEMKSAVGQIFEALSVTTPEMSDMWESVLMTVISNEAVVHGANALSAVTDSAVTAANKAATFFIGIAVAAACTVKERSGVHFIKKLLDINDDSDDGEPGGEAPASEIGPKPPASRSGGAKLLSVWASRSAAPF